MESLLREVPSVPDRVGVGGLLHCRTHNSPNKVVYIKRGTTGISGEMIGICDSLLVAMITEKHLECESSPLLHSL